MIAALAQPKLPLDDTDLPALIVLGRDDAAKAHASHFTANQALQARAAAAAMGMMVLPVTTDEQRDLASHLPAGKIFSSGKAFVPYVKGSLYEQLISHVPFKDQLRPLRLVKTAAEGEDEGAADAQGTVPSKPTTHDASVLVVPQDWSKIGPGCVVLAIADDRAEGWFESVILKAKGNTSFTLRWRDWPAEPHFERPLTGIALLHPSRSASE